MTEKEPCQGMNALADQPVAGLARVERRVACVTV